MAPRSTDPLGMGTLRARLVWLSLAVVAGCATPIDEAGLREQLTRAATTVPGLARPFEVVPIHADSRMAAWTSLAESRSSGSPEALRLSKRMQLAARAGMPVVVGGFYQDLAEQIVLEALERQRGRAMPSLTLVYVGDKDTARAVARGAARLDARFHHRELP